MNCQVTPVWHSLLHHPHQCTFSGNAAASSTFEVVAQPWIAGNKCRFLFADRTSALTLENDGPKPFLDTGAELAQPAAKNVASSIDNSVERHFADVSGGS